jgi:molecular chaperone GrpE
MKHKKHVPHSTNDLNSAGSNHGDSDSGGFPKVDSEVLDSSQVDATVSSSKYDELNQRLKAAENIAEEADSLYRRMAADFENYRKRVDRERQEFRGLGLQQAVEALFPALDDLDRAQSGLSPQMSPEDLLQSIKLVFNRIRQSVEQMGLRPIEAVGEHFDPKFHEPVQKIETSEFPDGVVMEVLRKGYKLNDKVIRPALVNVASAKPHDHQEESAESKT